MTLSSSFLFARGDPSSKREIRRHSLLSIIRDLLKRADGEEAAGPVDGT
jgi:hypothetical protein